MAQAQELTSEEQAQLCKSFALEEEKLELTYRKQVESLAWEAEMLWALLKDGPAVAGGEQDSTGGPIPLSAGRREQPCHVDTKQSPTPALAARVPSKSLGHSLGEISQDVLNLEKVAFVPTGRGLQVHPCGVDGGAVRETLLPSAGGPAGPSHPEGQQLLLGTEGDASSTQPQRVV